PGDGPLQMGYIDAHAKRPFRLTLKDQAIADAALRDRAEPYRRLDTGILEALVLKGTLGLSDDDISHFNGLFYARDADEAVAMMTGPERTTRMKATARRDGGNCRHTVQVRDHQVVVDELHESGGQDTGPDPQELLAVSLASCTAITIEMYAVRKGWDIGPVEV